MAQAHNPTDLRRLLRGVFSAQAKEPALLLSVLRQHWVNVVGPELGAKTEPQRLKGGVLWVAAPDACWAYELQFFKSELLASVRAFLDSGTVHDLRFQPGPVPELLPPVDPLAGPRTAPPAGPPFPPESAPQSAPQSAPEWPGASAPPTPPARSGAEPGGPGLPPAERPRAVPLTLPAEPLTGAPPAGRGGLRPPARRDGGIRNAATRNAAVQANPEATVEAPPALTRAAATIGDPALRAVFQRSLAKQRRAREQRGTPSAPAAASPAAPSDDA